MFSESSDWALRKACLRAPKASAKVHEWFARISESSDGGSAAFGLETSNKGCPATSVRAFK
ncbi:hypothetical protein HMSSN139_35170 [Paenibacillus sp. HMSSN-139]|nr:hypothetical protein HMSSN139_35170 [Paenibacillus sp. HMSSN-139]